jgi:formylglycine-generating enzyme required for sulfatase activity
MVALVQSAETEVTRSAVTNSISQSLQFIPAGTYIRGGQSIGEGGFFKDHPGYDGSDENPRHPVRLTKPFYLGTTEVTVSQFRQFQEATSYQTTAERNGAGIVGLDVHEPEKDWRAKFAFRQKPEFTWKSAGFAQQDDHPVVGVSWQDAQAFCRWLSGKEEGATYRLPNEAEWEYSCRGGSDTYFSWGDSYREIHRLANIGNTELERAHPERVLIQWIVNVEIDPGDPHVYTSPAGSYPANSWGIRDMHGNVWEWCQDLYLDTAYTAYKAPSYGRPIPRAIDPLNTETFNDDGDWRVIRGGSWFTSPLYCRSAVKSYYGSDDAAAYIGFRVVREASSEEIAAARQAFDAEERSRSIVKEAVGQFGSERGTDLRVQFSSTPSRDVTRELRHIGGLTEVHFSTGGRMDGALIADIAAVPSLRVLHLHHSGPNVTNEQFRPLAARTELEKLHISAYSTLTDDVVQHFAGLTNLYSLHLNCEKLTDDGLRQLRNLTKLRDLDIQGTLSNGEILAELKGTPLESLSVRRMTDETAEQLINFPALTSLTIYDSPMTERGFAAITGLRRLRMLRLRDCANIAPSAFAALANMHSLRTLDVLNTPVGDETLALLTNLELTSLELNSENVTDIGMQHVCSMLTLNRLVLGAKTRVTDRGLKHLWRLNRLKQFDLYSTHITGTGFATLAELPELYSLRLTSPALTDAVFGYLSETPVLNSLELGTQAAESSASLTDAGLQLLADKPNWRSLTINRRGTAITTNGIDQLRRVLKNTRLDVRE